MDLTVLFRACVKTVRTTNKSLGVTNPKTDVLKEGRKDVYLIRAREVARQITSLKKLLDENKVAYLNVLNYLSTNKTMSEVDRQHIDETAQKIINSCATLINNLKKELLSQTNSQQKQEHYLSVIDSIEQYLKNTSKCYTEVKALRVKRVIDTHKLSKLETDMSLPQRENISIGRLPQKSKTDLETNSETNSIKKKSVIPPHTPVEDIGNELSAEEIQMFESENEHLYNELNSLSDEVKQIESKVVHIAELQELFTEKVLQQDRDIERIATAVVTTTDNMKDANEQIKQAIQRNAGLRVWILFFLLVMSFSLLFLDWYND